MQDYRQLHVWERAHGLALEVRRAIRSFPRVGYAALQSQMARAAESVVFNIAEGCGTKSRKEFARFLDISTKSTCELQSQLELARDYGVLNLPLSRTLLTEAVEVRRMLCGLRAKVVSIDQDKPREGRD